MKILVTGANGHLGRRLIRRLLAEARHQPVAAVRSARAAAQLRASGVQCDIQQVDYGDAQSLKQAGAGCQALVHLAGVIKETRGNSFRQAHEDCCQALVDAALPLKRIICLGVLGTAADSANACFASRARAEAILLASPVPTLALRVPMVLGQGDHAARALAQKAEARLVFTFRAASREQPLASDDLIEAILAALAQPPANAVLTLAGPESLSRRRLIKRAAAIKGRRPAIASLPLWLGMALAWLLEKAMPAPPVTRAMLGVLDHDDKIDPLPAARQLGIRLTPLDQTLNAALAGKQGQEAGMIGG